MVSKAFKILRAQRKILAAALMLGLYLTLQAFAGSETLHQCLHEDSHEADHQCVITLVADGQLLATPVPAFEIQTDLTFAVPPKRPLPVFISGERLLPPGRAPPVCPV